MTPPKNDLEHQPLADALKQLSVDIKVGLSTVEAAKRLSQYGSNALEEQKTNQWAMFGKFFWGPMPWMIEAAAVMSIVVNDWVDFSIIVVLLVAILVEIRRWRREERSPNVFIGGRRVDSHDVVVGEGRRRKR